VGYEGFVVIHHSAVLRPASLARPTNNKASVPQFKQNNIKNHTWYFMHTVRVIKMATNHYAVRKLYISTVDFYHQRKNELLLGEPSQRTCKHQPSYLIFHTTVTDVTTVGTQGNKVFVKAVYLSVRVNYTLH